MDLLKALIEKNEKIAVIGLGYVGLPLAVAFAEKLDVIGYDIDRKRILDLDNGIDITNQINSFDNLNIEFTSDEHDLKKAKAMIIAVPTQINIDNTPNISLLELASRCVGKVLKRGDIIIYESTVYPGATEEICIPILEEESGLKCGYDFKVCYSPERINPSDKKHNLKNINKLIAGIDKESLEFIEGLYKIILKARLHKVSNIKIAEASKLIENSQRDINIAFMNEIAQMFNCMNIDTTEVLEAANTKWNFLDFKPGLVGGECIGVDPYYLIYKAKKDGYVSSILSASRVVNENMSSYIVNCLIKEMIKLGLHVSKTKILIMGITFKENCPDVKNSKVLDIIKYFEDYGIDVSVCDPIVNKTHVYNKYNINIESIDNIGEKDVILYAVKHDIFKVNDIDNLNRILGDSKNKTKIVFDVKGIFRKKEIEMLGYKYIGL